MKKIMFILVTTMMLNTSCGEPTQEELKEKLVEAQKKEAAREAAEERKKTGTQTFEEAVCGSKDFSEKAGITKFVYEGHRYIWFARTRGASDYRTGYAGVVHDPDCPKCRNGKN